MERRSMLQWLKEWLSQTTSVAILIVTLGCLSLLSEMEIVIVPTSEFFMRIKSVNTYKELRVVPPTQ